MAVERAPVTLEHSILLALADKSLADEFNDRIGEAIAVVSCAVHGAIESHEPLDNPWQAARRERELDTAFSPLYNELADQFWPIICQRFRAAAEGRAG